MADLRGAPLPGGGHAGHDEGDAHVHALFNPSTLPVEDLYEIQKSTYVNQYVRYIYFDV